MRYELKKIELIDSGLPFYQINKYLNLSFDNTTGKNYK